MGCSGTCSRSSTPGTWHAAGPPARRRCLPRAGNYADRASPHQPLTNPRRRAGFGIALIAVGGVLAAKSHEVAGIALDLLGVIFCWAAFQTYHDRAHSRAAHAHRRGCRFGGTWTMVPSPRGARLAQWTILCESSTSVAIGSARGRRPPRRPLARAPPRQPLAGVDAWDWTRRTRLRRWRLVVRIRGRTRSGRTVHDRRLYR